MALQGKMKIGKQEEKEVYIRIARTGAIRRPPHVGGNFETPKFFIEIQFEVLDEPDGKVITGGQHVFEYDGKAIPEDLVAWAYKKAKEQMPRFKEMRDA